MIADRGAVAELVPLATARWSDLALVRPKRDTALIPCLLALLALISPRLAILALWIFSDVLSRAYSSWVLPVPGFFLLPWTTLAYAAFWDWGPGHHVTGFEWFFVALAFVIDLTSYAGGQRARRGSAAA